MAKYYCVLFDADNTLLDFDAAENKALADTLREYGIDPEKLKKCDLHIHAPEGAVPKDGPSAGVTLTTALVSCLSGIPVRGDVAMTGEITLHGNVLPIGGLREKSMAAYREGMKTVLIQMCIRDRAGADEEPDHQDRGAHPAGTLYLHGLPGSAAGDRRPQRCG